MIYQSDANMPRVLIKICRATNETTLVCSQNTFLSLTLDGGISPGRREEYLSQGPGVRGPPGLWRLGDNVRGRLC